MQEADVPGGFPQDRVHAEILRFQRIHELDEQVHGAHAVLRIPRMERFARELEVERLRSLGRGHHAIVRGLAHDQVFRSEIRLRERLRAPRSGLLPGQQQHPEIGLPLFREPLARLHNGKHLPLRVARPPSFDDIVSKCGRDIRRNGIQVRAEDDAGGAPGEEEVEGAVADFLGAQLRPVRRREHPRQAFREPLGHLPLLSRSGIDA